MRLCSPWPWHSFETSTHCYSEDRTIMYAKFVPAKALCLSDEPAKLTPLEISPAGQELFDDILMSALVIERWKLTASGVHKSLFG